MSELPERPENSSAPPVDNPGDAQQRPGHQSDQNPNDPGHKATEFDGDPNPKAAEDSPSGLSPRDDTPMFLEKKSKDE